MASQDGRSSSGSNGERKLNVEEKRAKNILRNRLYRDLVKSKAENQKKINDVLTRENKVLEEANRALQDQLMATQEQLAVSERQSQNKDEAIRVMLEIIIGLAVGAVEQQQPMQE